MKTAEAERNATPEHDLVVALMERQLNIAEYASKHDGMLTGESTFWNQEMRRNAKSRTNASVNDRRAVIRKEFDEWLDEDNPFGCVQLMEMAGISEATIDAYVSGIKARKDGRVRTLEIEKPKPKRKYTGVYQSVAGKWYGQVTSRKRGVCWHGSVNPSEDAAMRERDEKIIAEGWTFAKLNVLTWEDAA